MLVPDVLAAGTAPGDNPVAAFYAQDPKAVPDWVGKLPWERVASIADFPGPSDDARLGAAQASLKGRGGVIYFPPGSYTFKDHIDLQDGVILRGETPAVGRAKDEKYALTTRFEFPKYEPSMAGEGTPIDTAFRSIRTADVKASNVASYTSPSTAATFIFARPTTTTPARTGWSSAVSSPTPPPRTRPSPTRPTATSPTSAGPIATAPPSTSTAAKTCSSPTTASPRAATTISSSSPTR